MIRLEPGVEFLPGLVLVRRLGEGGMGEAWVVRAPGHDEEIVAKILPEDAPEDRVALLGREARLVRKLHHPAIVPVYGFERGTNGSAILLRLMKGGDASRLRAASPLEVVRRGKEVADALVYLHGLGVVHRDVKLSNVLLDEDGRAHLADFGIAAVKEPEAGEPLLVRGGGSRSSMSPQQRRGEPPDPGDDVYALGVLLYELLSGRPPFPPDRGGQDGPSVPPPLDLGPKTPASLRDLVASMLANEASERPGMRAVVASLDVIESELGEPTEPAPHHGVRLHPPPRVPDVAVFPSLAEAPATPLTRRRPASRPLAPIALLGSLVVAALFVALVLPRWARSPSHLGTLATPEPGPAPPSPSAAEHPEGDAAAASAPLPLPPETALPSLVPPAEVDGALDGPRPAVAAARPRVEGSEEKSDEARPSPRTSAEFEAAMTEAYAAIEVGDLAAARRALEKAAAVRPGEAAVDDALRAVEERERADALARHREAALALEAKEDWQGALAEYEGALKVDPTVAFALDGRRRAASRVRLDERLDFHAHNPQRLTTEAVAREAEGVLEEAREVDSPGPRLRRQMAALERALARARALVTVVLESDGVTQVVVHKVGTLGTFTRKSLELHPGTYVVVGTRRGYRDVRQTLVVDPDAPSVSLVVRCEEAI